MVFEIIGKVMLYIIGTLLFGAFICAVNDDIGDNGLGVFVRAWLAGILVFIWLILP